LRVFLAVPLTQDVHRQLEQEKARLQPVLPDVRWVRSGTLHLTLVFLGEVAEAEVELLRSLAHSASRRVAAGRMAIKGRGCFPERGRVRVVWVGVEDVRGTLQVLRQALLACVRRLGLPEPDGTFRPHLTLGRSRRGLPRALVRRGLDAGHALDLGEMAVTECVLVRSTLESGGARHDVVQRFPLGEELPCP
jgi:2'-5' RNA ligase